MQIEINALLKKHWGPTFTLYDYQQEIINVLCKQKDALILLPTGAGKSLCFQLAGIYLKGLTLVVSPLLALMEDQVNALKKKSIPAEFLNGLQSQSVQNTLLTQLKKTPYAFLYLSPEQLAKHSIISFLKSYPPQMVVTDEAHCISMWGNDFRPAYEKIPQALAQLSPRPHIAAFTATAPPKIQADLIQNLELNNPFVYFSYPLNTHIGLSVKRVWTPQGKQRALFQALNKKTLIYAASRQATEDLCQGLKKKWPDTQFFHAGLSQTKKSEILEDFNHSSNGILVATKAFGMGIDISDIRQVIHWHLPENIESYVQEVGRGGRDKQPAQGLVLWQWQETQPTQHFIKYLLPEKEVLLKILRTLKAPCSEYILQDKYQLQENQLNLILGYLKREGSLTSEKQIHTLKKTLSSKEEKACLNWLKTYHKQQVEKYVKLCHFLKQRTGCRIQKIDFYFGKEPRPVCGQCDGCKRTS